MRVRFLLFVLIAVMMLGCGCSKRPQRASDVPRVLSHQYTIAVMPFTQPTTTPELIMGQLPRPQGLVPAGRFSDLDVDLRDLLQSKKNDRHITYASLDSSPRHNPLALHESGKPNALASWVQIGKRLGKHFILVPQVLDWHERKGSGAGVDKPTHVRLEMYLIRVDRGTVQNRAIYEEEQQGLADNLLAVGDFVRRRGAWVDARRLAKDGMTKMLRELGL